MMRVGWVSGNKAIFTPYCHLCKCYSFPGAIVLRETSVNSRTATTLCQLLMIYFCIVNCCFRIYVYRVFINILFNFLN